MADKGIKYIITVAAEKARQELENVNKKLEEMEKQSKALDKMRQGALVMGGAMAVGLGLAVAQAVKFESALAPVKSVLTGTAAEVQAASARIGSAAMEWSSRYSQSSEEFLQASYNMLSAGLNEVQALAGTQQALALATATMGDASTASQLMGTLYNNFADKTRNATAEMTMLSDVVTKTQQAFQIANLGQLNEGLKYAAASAQAFKVSFMQTSAVVGQLNTLGLSGSMAGTAFNAMMAKLNEGAGTLGYTVAKTADGGIDLVKTLENVKKVGADADTLNKVFGQEGAKGIILLTEKIGDLQKNYELVKNSAGATAAAQAEFEKTFASQSKVLGNNMSNLGVTLGNVLLPALAAVLRIVNPLVAGFSKLLNENKLIAGILVTVVAVFSAALTIFGSWVFWTKTAAMVQGLWNAQLIIFNAVNPFMLVAIGIAAVVTGIVLLVKHWDAVVGKIKAVRDIIAISLVKAWDEAVAKITGFWNNFTAKMEYNWHLTIIKITRFFTPDYWAGLGRGILSGLMQTLDNVRGFFQTAFSGDFWAGLWQNMIDSFFSALKKMWDGIAGWWHNIVKLARGEKVEQPAVEIAKDQQQATDTLPAQKAMPASKAKIPKSSPSGSETDWGMNSEFLAANGLGGGVKPSAKTIDTVRAGVQNVTHNKGGAVDNSRSIHIANVTIDGANITDFETFRLELSAAVGGMA